MGCGSHNVNRWGMRHDVGAHRPHRLNTPPSHHLHARASPSPKYTPRQTLNVTELEVTHGGGLRWRVKLRSVRPEKINEGSGAGHTYHIGFGVSVNLKMSFWCTTLREGRTRFFFTFVEGLIITLHSNPPKIARNNLHTTYRRDTHGHRNSPVTAPTTIHGTVSVHRQAVASSGQ